MRLDATGKLRKARLDVAEDESSSQQQLTAQDYRTALEKGTDDVKLASCRLVRSSVGPALSRISRRMCSGKSLCQR